jgi:hypothetical protein
MTRARIGRIWLVSAFLCLVLGTAVEVDRLDRGRQEDDISEAAFKDLMQSPDVRIALQQGSVFISRENHRISQEFIARLGEQRESIRLANHDLLRWRDLVPYDVATGKPATIVHLGKIRRLDWRTAEVEGSYHCGPLCGFGAHLHLHRVGLRTWRIDFTFGGWVSFLCHHGKSRPC